MKNSIRQLLTIFNKKEKVQLFFLLLLMMATGAVEALGVSLIFPFIGMVSDPSMIQKNEILNFLFQLFDGMSEKNFIILTGCLLIAFFIFKNLFYITSQYVQQSYLIRKRVALTGALFQGYMRSKYEFHLNTNPAILLRNINAVDGVFSGLLQPSFEIISETIILCCVAGVLVISNPTVSIGACLFIAIPIWGLNRFISAKLRKLGAENFNLVAKSSKALLEGLNGIKEIQVMNRQNFFATTFLKLSYRLGFIRRDLVIMNHIPRLAMEPILISSLILFIIYILIADLSIMEFLPIVSLFSVAAFRILYSLNKVVLGGNNISFNKALSSTIIDELHTFEHKVVTLNELEAIRQSDEKLNLDQGIALDKLTFSYENSEAPAINDLSLYIKKGTSIAFVGSSGAGKSTLVDLILGLLEASDGNILVDGQPINKVKEEWQNSIGYIPQSIYLCDDTLRNNIAFGVPEEEIDNDALNRAIEIAQLRSVVEGLPEGLNTLMGDRGVRLSGGQRQRVAIARALYHDPEIILMDEATSALDNQTEAEFIKAVDAMKQYKTMIIVAHRLTTVKDCDTIFVLQDGKLIGEGNLQELMTTNSVFQRLAQMDPGLTANSLVS